jgi:hypothetical protein
VDDTLRTCEAYLMLFPESTIATEALICDTHYINLREMNCNCASFEHIICDELGFHKVCARRIP